MGVYVDNYRARFRGMRMSHMVADSLDELHDMAKAIGMKRAWFQPRSSPHYDVSVTRRARAIELGAIAVTARDLVRVIRKARAKGEGR